MRDLGAHRHADARNHGGFLNDDARHKCRQCHEVDRAEINGGGHPLFVERPDGSPDDTFFRQRHLHDGRGRQLELVLDELVPSFQRDDGAFLAHVFEMITSRGDMDEGITPGGDDKAEPLVLVPELQGAFKR